HHPRIAPCAPDLAWVLADESRRQSVRDQPFEARERYGLTPAGHAVIRVHAHQEAAPGVVQNSRRSARAGHLVPQLDRLDGRDLHGRVILLRARVRRARTAGASMSEGPARYPRASGRKAWRVSMTVRVGVIGTGFMG